MPLSNVMVKSLLSSICNTAQHSSGHEGNNCLCVCMYVCESVRYSDISVLPCHYPPPWTDFKEQLWGQYFSVWHQWWPNIEVYKMCKETKMSLHDMYSVCVKELDETNTCSTFECEGEMQSGDRAAGRNCLIRQIRYFHLGWHFDTESLCVRQREKMVD